MKGLLIPEQTEDYSADPVELFFDLAFVFAFSQLVSLLVHHPDWNGVGRASLLFLLLWMPWTQFTWSANAVPGNQRSVRIAFLVATAASVPMAAAVETAFDASGALFAIPLAVIHVSALALMAVGYLSDDAHRGSDELASTLRYAAPNVVAMIVLVIGGFLTEEARTTAWIVSLLIVIWATIRAGEGEWTVRPGHFAERHGLIVIIALGEVIVALGNAVVTPLNEGDGFPGTTVLALIATGAAAGLLWWAYFDRAHPSMEYGAEREEVGRPRYVRDVFSYAHAPIVAGVIFMAAGLEEAALHPGDDLPLAFRMMLLGGFGLFMGGISIGVYRAFRVVAKERLVAGLVVAAVLGFGGELDGVLLIVIFDIVLIAALIAEHLRVEGRSEKVSVASAADH